MWRDILCYHGAGRHDGTLSYVYTIEDDGPGTDPRVIVYYDTLGRNPLFDNRTGWVIVYVIYGDNLNKRRCINVIADSDSALPAEHIEFTDQTVLADFDPSVWQAAKVINMEFRVVHDESVFANHNPLRKGVEINTFVEVDTASQLNPVSIAEAHVRLDSHQTVHLEQGAICDRADGDPNDGGDTAHDPLEELLDAIATRAASLALKVKKTFIQ
jgi:hypothetical protein